MRMHTGCERAIHKGVNTNGQRAYAKMLNVPVITEMRIETIWNCHLSTHRISNKETLCQGRARLGAASAPTLPVGMQTGRPSWDATGNIQQRRKEAWSTTSNCTGRDCLWGQCLHVCIVKTIRKCSWWHSSE